MSARPPECCGMCPPIMGGGYDCTCTVNPNCPNLLRAIARAHVYHECHESVTRKGELEPCDKPAVAVRLDGMGGAYPVCKHHARGDMATLTDIREALR